MGGSGSVIYDNIIRVNEMKLGGLWRKLKLINLYNSEQLAIELSYLFCCDLEKKKHVQCVRMISLKPNFQQLV